MKTVSYKLAKKLKELGFKGKTTHYWIKSSGYDVNLSKGKAVGFIEGDHLTDEKRRPKRYKAPTLDEMIKALPDSYKKEGKYLVLTLYKGAIGYFSSDWVGYNVNCEDGNLADACAKLWILLKGKGLV